MYEPPRGGPGDGYQPHQGGSGPSDRWPYEDWFQEQPGREYAPGPGQEYGPEYQQYEQGYQENEPPSHDPEAGYGRTRRRRGGHRRADPGQAMDLEDDDPTLDPAITSVDFIPAPRARWNWALIVGVAFFLADTILRAIGFASPVGAGALIMVIVIWLVG